MSHHDARQEMETFLRAVMWWIVRQQQRCIDDKGNLVDTDLIRLASIRHPGLPEGGLLANVDNSNFKVVASGLHRTVLATFGQAHPLHLKPPHLS